MPAMSAAGRSPGLSRRALLAALGAGAAGCTGRTLEYTMHSVYDDPNAPKGLPFRTGQILLSEAPGPYGILFTLAPDRFFRFTHSALIVTDPSGEPFVYDMSAEFKPTLATAPAGSLFGGIRRTPLADYVSLHLYVEVFEPPANVDRARVSAKVHELMGEHVGFDSAWDFYDHHAMFCSEFVVTALAAGGAPIPPLVPLTHNRSLRRVLTWFGVTAVESLPAAALPRERRVAAFSIWPTRPMAEAYLEAKREIYRRFTDDQNIGNLLELKRYDVQLRPPVAEFLERAPELYAGVQAMPPEAEMRIRVQALADAVFGAFPGPT
ncbi:MAG TPA: hypothetical protein VMI54_13305 [Polyangiaceae bacterium]|nr:hypothetical protein [Polyangiaceae bacterium]